MQITWLHFSPSLSRQKFNYYAVLETIFYVECFTVNQIRKSLLEYVFQSRKILCVLVENADIFRNSMLRPYSSEKYNEYTNK